MSETVRVKAVMTAPRQEITWCRSMIEAAFRRLGLPLAVSGGVFYHQNMQRMFEDAFAEGVDYIVTVDYDSVFVAEDVQRLISVIHQEGFDALASMQCKRGTPSLLACKEQHTSAKWTGYPIQVDCAHFGLTVLRVSSLEGVVKPWFVCQPDGDGSWGDGRIDSDVWFWKQWKSAGRNLYIDPGCRIGHTEEMVVMFNDDMKPVHLYPKEFEQYHADRIAEKLASERSGDGTQSSGSGCRGSACQSHEGCEVCPS